MEHMILSIDIGTSSCKTALFSESGTFITVQKEGYPLIFPGVGEVEQDPTAIWNGVCSAVNKLQQAGSDLSSVCAITFSAQIASQCLVDQSGKPLTNLLSWMDTRAQDQAEAFRRQFSQQEAERMTGVDMVITPSYSIAKLRWLRENASATLDKAAKFVQIKDYIIYLLTGEWVSDSTSLKGLVHARTGEPIPEIFSFMDVSPQLLPRVRRPYEIAGYLKENVNGLKSLNPGIPVVVGWNDMNAAYLGMGALSDGFIGMDMTGTSEHLGCVGPVRKVASEQYEGINRVPFLMDREVFYGVTSSGGQAIEWFTRDIMGAADAKALFASLFDTPDGAPICKAKDLLFLPYLEGERNPWNNPDARGVFFGLSRDHRPSDLAIAVLEGVCFALRAIFDRLPQKPEKIVVSGGASRDQLWNQMKADVMNVPIVRLDCSEAGCTGAAILAMAALNPRRSPMEISREILHTAETFTPNCAHFGFYEEKYQLFLKLYRTLEPLFKRENR